MMRAVLSLLLLTTAVVFGQPSFVQRYTVENGLSQNLVLSMAEDTYGFLWFGTKDGLNRFDGYSFHTFRSDLNNPRSLSSNYISALLVDSAGTLWIGTAGGGLNRFHEETGTFSSWQHREHDSTSIPSNYVVDIAATGNGHLLVATQGGGISLFDTTQKTFRPLFDNVPEQAQAPLKAIRCMFLEHDTLLWIGTHDAGLWRYELHSKKILNYNARMGKRGPSNNRIKSISKDSRGVLWVCTENGIEALDPLTKTFSVHRFPDKAGNPQPGISIRELPDGTYFVNVWTDQGLYDPQTRVFESKRFGVINLTFRDRSGMLWLSASGQGVIKYNPLLERFHRREGEFFYELFRKDFTEAAKQLPFHPSSETIDLATVAKGTNGELWFFKKGNGYYRYNTRTKALKVFPAGDAAKGIRFQFLPRTFIDRENTVWISESTILARYNRASDTFTYFSLPSYIHNPELLRNNTEYPPITTLYKDARGVVWLGTTGMGLLRFNPERKELILYQRDADAPITLTNNFILAIHPDPSDSTILWLGTDGGGLNRFDTNIGTVTHHFTTAEGLPNNVIYGILSDHRGRLWMSSNNGLFVFDPAAMKLLDRYDVNDGLQSNEFNRYQFWKDEQGRLYFGGINGWNSFDPDEIQPRQYVPPIVLTDLRIFNVSLVYPHIRPPLQTSLQRTNRVVLESNQNMLTIEFASLDYAAPRKVRYKYLLEGLDEHWVEVSSTDGEGQNRTEAKRTATYTNLEPGEYLFRVKGTNSDGVWNETERTLSIVIVPPFWKTTWFRASAVLFVFVLVAASVRYFELRKIRERTRQLEQEAAIERERLRISKDMHDDLGSRLTHIELLSNLTARNMKDRQSVERNLQDISAAADELVTAFDEIVWAVNPHYDTVEGLMDYLAQFVSSYLDRSGIESHVDLPAAPAQVAISAESRHNIFMMVKEALNNSVKYAQAKDVWLQFDCTGSQLTVTVKDNGVGFDVTAVKKFSEGLANMKKRMEDIGGTCTVESAPGKGTTVTAVVPLTSSKNHPNG